MGMDYLPGSSPSDPLPRISGYTEVACTCTCDAPFQVRELEQRVLDLQRMRYARYIIPKINYAERRVDIERWGDGGGHLCFVPFDLWRQIADELSEHPTTGQGGEEGHSA